MLQLQGNKNKFFFTASLLLAFSLPFYRQVVVYLIALWIIAWFLDGHLSEKWDRFKKNQYIFWGFSSIIWVQLIGLSYSIDIPDGWFIIQKKLSFLIFPLFLSSIDFSKEEVKKIIQSFVIGVLFAGTICLFRGAYFALSFNDTDYLFYNLFSYFMHPSYLGMYLSIVLLYIIIIISKTDSKEVPFKYLFLQFAGLFYVLILITFTSSKASLLTAILLVAAWLLILIIKKKKAIASAIILLSIALGVYFGHKALPQITLRVNVAWQSISSPTEKPYSEITDGSLLRLIIWKESINLIKESPLLGYGTGSAQVILTQKYAEKDLRYAEEKKLNSHNQFLQQTIENGIPGLFSLIAVLLIPLIASLKRKSIFSFGIVAIITINMLFECILGLQAGIVFSALFLSLVSIPIKPSFSTPGVNAD